MSIYSELLAISLTLADDPVEAGASNEKRLLEELTECRDRLDTKGIAASHRLDAPSRIATELQYDRALIKLCLLHEIACDAAAFTRPQHERRRLEEALEAAGVDVRVRRRHDSGRATTAGGHEPPAGS